MNVSGPPDRMLDAFEDSNAAYNKLFALYYDRITGHKDYRVEVDALASHLAALGIGSGRRLLDVGCGTGGHANLMAEAGFEVVAVDLSPDMIEAAMSKLGKATFVCGDLAELNTGESFDAAYSLFNVVNCLPSLAALIEFFAAVAARIRPGAPFFLEAWNAVAVIAVPPDVVERTFEADGERIVRNVLPTQDFLRQRLDLCYDISCFEIGSGRLSKQFSVVHQLVLFTPLEIDHALRAAGFDRVKVLTALPDLKPAGDADRMLAFVARKSD